MALVFEGLDYWNGQASTKADYYNSFPSSFDRGSSDVARQQDNSRHYYSLPISLFQPAKPGTTAYRMSSRMAKKGWWKPTALHVQLLNVLSLQPCRLASCQALLPISHFSRTVQAWHANCCGSLSVTVEAFASHPPISSSGRLIFIDDGWLIW